MTLHVYINSQRGRTALMVAVLGGNKRIIQALLNLETKNICDTNVQEKVCELITFQSLKVLMM